VTYKCKAELNRPNVTLALQHTEMLCYNNVIDRFNNNDNNNNNNNNGAFIEHLECKSIFKSTLQ